MLLSPVMNVIKVEFSGRTVNTHESNIKLKVTLPFYTSEKCNEFYARQQKKIEDHQVKYKFF